MLKPNELTNRIAKYDFKKKEQTDNANTNAEEKDLANDTCGPPYRRANRYVGIPSNTRVH